MSHQEQHRTGQVAWLRAAVLGANDGLISTSSLVVGVASAQASHGPILLAALAGMVAGALSMAAGEYVSVSTQADTEAADLAREHRELTAEPEHELAELAGIYVSRGLSAELAHQVAQQLTAYDALGSHARDELGITDLSRARPIVAALTSAIAFATGALPPVCLVLFLPLPLLGPSVLVSSLLLLMVMGALAARLGRASVFKGAARVAFWGALAMGCTALVGRIFGTVS